MIIGVFQINLEIDKYIVLDQDLLPFPNQIFTVYLFSTSLDIIYYLNYLI